MSLPTTFDPLIIRIQEMLVSGSGTAPYTIPTGSYSLMWFYEDRKDEQLARDVVSLPQAKVKITDFSNANAWYQPNTKTMYDVNLSIEIAYPLKYTAYTAGKYQLERDVANRAVVMQKALCFPNNLLTTISGSETGLASGRLNFDRYTNVSYNFENNLAKAEILFTGKVTLSNG